MVDKGVFYGEVYAPSSKSKSSNKKLRENNNIKINGIDIQKIDSDSTKVKTNPLMELNIIPRYPSSTVLIGPSGAGKSTVLLNMFLNTDMFKNFFKKDNIYLFTQSALTDDMFNKLKLEKKNIFADDLPENLEKVFNRRRKQAESKGVENIEPVCYIFEDVSLERELLKDKIFQFLFVACRHFGISVFCCCHKFKSLPRVARLQISNMFLFPCALADIQQIVEDCTPIGMDKRDFLERIRFALQKTEEHPRPFLYLNKSDRPLRKTFNTYIN